MKKTLSILRKMKDKLSDIWNEITYYIYDLPKHWFLSIRGWYRIYCKNPYYWKEMKYTFNENAPWDSSYFYETQYLWLQKSVYYFENHCKYIDEKQIAFIVASQKLALKMLEIYLEKIDYADDMYNVEPHEIYRQKAIRLYHKIVAKNSNTWWD